tara:strand:+ start:811 stop:984 length:174 start_codon:yes stop_codon:yes gene_type:complete
MKTNFGRTPKEAVYDRGGKGQKQIEDARISTPDYRPLKKTANIKEEQNGKSSEEEQQ